MDLSSQHHGAPSFETLPPELQQEIFSYLNKDNKSLFAVIRVNKTWYRDCIGMLWHKSTQERLVKVPSPERRQHYANMIFQWTLDHESFPAECYERLDFPMLKDLLFEGGSLSVAQLRHCMSVRLRTLQISYCQLDAAILDLAATYCTQLRTLIIEGSTIDNITPDRFMTLLQSLPALRRLDLDQVEEGIMNRLFEWEGESVAQLEELTLFEDWRSQSRTDYALRNKFLKHCTGLRKLDIDLRDTLATDALIQLSSHPLLELLHINGWLSDVDFQQRFVNKSPVARPFSSIKDLSVYGEVSTIGPLLSCLPNTLTSLELGVDDNSDSILPIISRLSNLVHLRIEFDCNRRLSRTDLDCISRLSLLQKCNIDWYSNGPARDGVPAPNDCPWLTDEYFKGWISKLPSLQDLYLGLESSAITQASVRALADSCPSLLQCFLMWEHDLSTWTSMRAPLFPNLEFLSLGKIKHYGHRGSQTTNNKDVSRIVKVIRSLAPRLKSLDIGQYVSGGHPPHIRALMDAFEEST